MPDRFGRPLTSLRISVTDRCNIACWYCHREGVLTRTERPMTPQEIGEIVGLAKEFGVRKIKLTGGEPLLRGDIMDVVAVIASQSFDDLAMSTNGTLLVDRAEELAEAGLDRINISLDTLNPETYRFITGSELLKDVLAGIDAAVDAGLVPVKLNMVLLAGVNDGEIEEMIAFASRHGAILQLIELVQMPALDQIYAQYHRKLDDIEEKLRQQATKIETRARMHNRKKYFILKGEVEVVNPMHNSEFCAHCTRLRLTSDGYLKPCLLRGDNLVNILSPICAGNLSNARKAFAEAIKRREPYFKPS